jgi:hypothetical protein
LTRRWASAAFSLSKSGNCRIADGDAGGAMVRDRARSRRSLSATLYRFRFDEAVQADDPMITEGKTVAIRHSMGAVAAPSRTSSRSAVMRLEEAPLHASIWVEE